jgi:ferrochelatase
MSYDSILIVSFGGPERTEDVMPFLENVLRGRNVPRERMMEVAEHYYHFGGRSPINDQNRELIAGLEALLAAEGPNLPVYFGNRNWHPMLAGTLRQMRDDGRKKALAFFTSAFGSYSGCRQYRENIADAQAEVGEGAPVIDKLRWYGDNPGFLTPVAEGVRSALEEMPDAHLAFTAHSIPMSMADTSPYVGQLQQACARVAEMAGATDWRLVYQSRSGSPSQPWLEPDILDHMRGLTKREVIVCPIGFISDHMEVLYDLDTEAAQLADELGMKMIRTPTVGTHPMFLRMIRDFIAHEQIQVCAADCCPRPTLSRPIAARPG